jgi:GNAT superfamily N-acetyltransferase
MWWRVPHGGKLWESVKGERNRQRLRQLLTLRGALHAVMAFAGEQPAGWCSFGPTEGFPRLETVRALKRDRKEGTWAVVCFYIHPQWRRRGLGRQLLEAATARAQALGARAVEGYPVVPKSGPIPAAFAWTGVPEMFEDAGYTELYRAGAARPIYIKET